MIARSPFVLPFRKPHAARFCTLFAIVLIAFHGVAMAEEVPSAIKSPKSPYPTFGKLESNDPRFDKLFPTGAKMEKLAEGFEWCEGPVWVADGKFVLFSDIPRNMLMKWKDGEGISVYMKPSGYTGIVDYGREPGSNANTLDSQGRLTQCEHGDRRISVLTKNGGKRTLVDNYQGQRLNSPNDLVFNSKGDLFFTDPIYGLPQHENDPRRELDFCGVYVLRNATRATYNNEAPAPTKTVVIEPAHELKLITKDMTRPNGLAFSPDEKKLYVTNSDAPNKAIYMVFELQPDGSYGNGKLFFDASDRAKAGKVGNPDGMKVDKDGNLWATGPGGLLVFAPDGTHLGTINPDSGDPISNCAWGDDGSTLYMTVNHTLARIKTNTKGAGLIKFE
jgi:gluconolactonase